MSYESINELPRKTRVADVLELVESLNYRRILRSKLRVKDEIAEYHFFDNDDYKSWSGISLSVFQKKGGKLKTFGGNLIKADIYLMSRTFPNKQWEKTGVLEFVDAINPA